MVYITCKHEMEMNNMIAYEGKVLKREEKKQRHVHCANNWNHNQTQKDEDLSYNMFIYVQIIRFQ